MDKSLILVIVFFSLFGLHLLLTPVTLHVMTPFIYFPLFLIWLGLAIYCTIGFLQVRQGKKEDAYWINLIPKAKKDTPSTTTTEKPTDKPTEKPTDKPSVKTTDKTTDI